MGPACYNVLTKPWGCIALPLEQLQVLKDLIDAPSPSGFEQPAQEVYRRAVEPYADEVHTDVMGNAYAILNPGGNPKIMLAGHCDEIGFLVTYINSDGYIYFGSIGGHDAAITVGQRVFVHTETGPLLGVIGKKPIHLMEEEERGRKTILHDLFIDIGAQGKAAVAEKVQIGDPITYSPGFAMLEGDLAVAHAFDDKVGAFAVAETIRLLKGKTLAAAVYGVSTVQEEIGLRGARTSSYFTGATVGLAVDVGFATDYPGMNKNRVGDVEIGKGPTICRGANINPQVYKMLCETARDLEIPFQLSSAGGGTGTDANAMQLNQAGMATGLVSIPLRYMHTPCELVCLEDVQNTARLMAGFIERVTADTDFTPSMQNRHAGVRPPSKNDKKPEDKKD
ncbi:MAG: peptidase family protein [Capsulimonas sp.]|nr:peptidase family protein [Capsulimonas sp.]